MKIKYVQLESDAFITDLDFIHYSPAERGVFLTIILFLYSHGGKCKYDPAALGRLCNCKNQVQFEEHWQKVSKKFQVRNDVIKHKRVTKELNRAKKFHKACAQAGLKGAQKRWGGHNVANSEGMTKERKGNVIEKENKDNTSNTSSIEQSCSFSNSVRSPVPGNSTTGMPNRATEGEQLMANTQERYLQFYDALISIIPPRSRSDRTCFRNLARWLAENITRGRFNDKIYGRVLDYATEATTGQKPAAVFMALLKKELEYDRKCKI
jgi:uncharacterized protein YdaU (DUF1376 family)